MPYKFNPFTSNLDKTDGVSDHGALTGLSDDDHTQYTLADGTRAFTGTQTFNENIEMKDDKKLYLDTAKTSYIEYNTNIGGLVIQDANGIFSPGEMALYSNCGADGLGNYEPCFNLGLDGSFQVANTSQGDVANRYFGVNMEAGLWLMRGGYAAKIKVDNITAHREFQFPNISGTFVTTAGAGGNIDIGAYTITGTQFISDIAIGTAPFVVTSTTEVSNLRAATASNLAGTPALPDGTTATTQGANDNSTKLATTAYADAGGGGGGSVGGTYGINVETLTGNKTLTANTDNIYQYLNPNGANKVVTIATTDAVAGDRFVIRNTGTYTASYYIEVKQLTTRLDLITAGTIKEYIYNGTNWVMASDASGGTENSLERNLALGRDARAYSNGVAIGCFANGWLNGVAIGYSAEATNNAVGIGYNCDADGEGISIGADSNGTSKGVGIGKSANGRTKGVAIGYIAKTNSKYFSVALGYYSETERYSEIAHNINGYDTDQENNLFTIGLEKQTANATPVEMLCGGQASQRITVRASSVLTFTGLVTARDNVSGDCAAYKIEGAIKRDASNNTAMLAAATVTVIHEDDASWNCTVAADDTNEALVITVTGDDTNPTQWAARVDAVETHF